MKPTWPIAILAALPIALPAWAAPTVIDFEDAAFNASLQYLYAGLGVTFGAPVFVGTNQNNETAPQPHSGTHLAQQFEGEFNAAPLTFDFATGQTHVSFYGCNYGSGATGLAKAFDKGGSLVVQDGPRALGSATCTTQFDLRSTAANIAHVEFTVSYGPQPAPDLAIDDLLFEGGAPPPPVPTDTPVIAITSPADGSVIDATAVAFSGSVTGNGLLPNMSVVASAKQMPWNQAPPQAYSVALQGTGTTRAFSQSLPHVPMGFVTLTATEGNTGGKQGTASVSIANLPPALRDGGGALGPLQGVLDATPTCRIAVYAKGALATDGTNTFSITPTILPKWLEWVGARRAASPGDYCPTENERPLHGSPLGPGGQAVRAQNFVGGRIFGNLPDGSHWVPAVFATEIDKYTYVDGEAAIGIPTSDPKTSPRARTWMFQQFARLDQANAIPTTIEIKGTPPVLWLERQGVLAQDRISWTPNAPTMVEQRPCTGNYGPCDFSHNPPVADNPPLPDGSVPCSGRTYPFGGPAEWEVVRGDNHDLSPVTGLVRVSKMSDGDWIGSHSFSDDWNIILEPLPGSMYVLATDNNPQELELEWEEYFWNYFVTQYGLPLVGDLMFVSGRWIVDCGHSSFSTEIHPPQLVSFMRTGSTNGQPTTDAYIWVNGFYTGVPVDVNIMPPPRPAPNAFLVANKPFDSDAAVGLSVEFQTDADATSFVRAHFSAPLRLVNVDTATGEMMWQTGREYMGRWQVFWQIDPPDVTPVGTVGPAWWP